MKTNLKESVDTFRDIVRKYAELYRDSELSRRDKEQYNAWLQSHSDKLNPSIRKQIEKKVDLKMHSKTEATTTGAVAGVMTPFAFSKRGPGNLKAATSSTGFSVVKPIKKSSKNKLAIENQMYSEPGYVNPAVDIEPVDTYKDENGLVQHGEPDLDPGLSGRKQSSLPMYEKVSKIIEGINGFKYKLTNEADEAPQSNPQAPAQQPQQQPQQQQPTQPKDYSLQQDFTEFDSKLKNSTEQLKVNLQKKIQDQVLNKKIIIRASKGVKQPESDFTINATGVNIDYYYDRYVVIIIGREEGKKKTSKFFVKPGFKIKILGKADIRPKDKYQIDKANAIVDPTKQSGSGSSNVVTSSEPEPKKPDQTGAEKQASQPAPAGQ